MRPTTTCAAIDFGTSNSAIVLVQPADGEVRLVELEPGRPTMPTAVFYRSDEPLRHYGREAIAAYVDGYEGRLMRSMKSVLGSDLLDQATEIGPGQAVRLADVVAGYLAELKRRAEASAGQGLDRVVLGRPVYFVDDDPRRDARAQAALHEAARRVGFSDVRFQYEPIAAALDHERRARHEHCVLVADIGGGTSDFSVVRVGPERAQRLERKDDILANHGVHIAGTDFDRRVELAAILPEFGYGAYGPSIAGAPPREVPSGVYFDLATWHLINTVYNPARVAELRSLRPFYADTRQHDRLMTVVEERLGHELAARAEGAKIAVAEGGHTRIDLSHVERALAVELGEAQAVAALEADIERIVAAARETALRAGLGPSGIDALYFTGGSTGLRLLAQRIAAAFPAARVVRGDRFASVASGLAVFAQRWFDRPA